MAEVFNNIMKHNPDSYRDIFLGLGILLFVVFTVCSLQVKASFQADDLSSSPLELVELAAKAQTGGENGTPPTGTCCPTNSGATCIVGLTYRTDAYYLSEGDCPNPNS